jgi:hypothetical protein
MRVWVGRGLSFIWFDLDSGDVLVVLITASPIREVGECVNGDRSCIFR